MPASLISLLTLASSAFDCGGKLFRRIADDFRTHVEELLLGFGLINEAHHLVVHSTDNGWRAFWPEQKNLPPTRFHSPAGRRPPSWASRERARLVQHW